MPTNFSRSPITVFEITQPMCEHAYGASPCTATATDQCRNTFKTCRDTANYSPVNNIKLRFCKPAVRTVDGEYIIPALVSTSTAPSKINPNVANRSSGPLGERAVASITLTDFKHSDFLVDPYRTARAYDPGERSTFWRKWLARNPYHEGYSCRIYDGYEGQSLAEMSRRDYMIDRVDGPTNDRVTIKAKDPLKMADSVRAQAPAASTGLLSAGIADSGAVSTFAAYDTLPGDYHATGTVRIGDEIFTYTGTSWLAGTTTFTGVTRATDGSEMSDHDAGDTVQLCLRFTSVPAWQVARDLLQDYAGIPSGFIPYADWTAEASRYIPGYTVTALISDPTGVNTLLGELCQQCLFYLWWDERDSEIKFRAIRTYAGADLTISDNANIIEDSMSVKRKPEDRISQVWLYYLPRDRTKKLDDVGNYRTRRVRIDASAESDFEYGSKRVMKIFSRWLESDAQAISTGARILNASRDVPQHVTLRLDAKDRELWTAGIVDINSRNCIDENGNKQTQRYQVISAEEVMPGETVQYDMIRFIFFGRPAFYMDAGAPVYASATDEQKTTGGWYSNAGGLMSDGLAGYTYQ